MKVTAERIRRLAPRAKPEIVAAIVDGWPKSGISDRLEGIHFLATITHESGGLTKLEEGMNYTRPERIAAIWPTRFRTVASAKPYVRQPRKLANKVYGRRLGNTGPNDGWLYRGGGLIQTTGRDNYRAAGFEDNPEALRQPVPGFAAAVEFWTRRKCGRPARADNTVAVRKLVNGGRIGLADVQDLVNRGKAIWPEGEQEAKRPLPDVRQAQERLRDLGYYEVGEVDGRFGPRTRNALNAFKADNDLPLVRSLDVHENLTDDVVLLLAEGRKRAESQSRAEATPKDLAKRSVTVTETIKNKVWSAFAAVGSAVATAFWGIVSMFQEAWDYTEPLRDALYKVSPVVWFGLATAIALFLYLRSRKVETRIVEDYRKGKKL